MLSRWACSARATCSSAPATDACAAFNCASAWAICSGRAPFSRRSRFAFACATWPRACSTLAWMSRLSSSAITWPGVTASPSETARRTMFPDAWALTSTSVTSTVPLPTTTLVGAGGRRERMKAAAPPASTRSTRRIAGRGRCRRRETGAGSAVLSVMLVVPTGRVYPSRVGRTTSYHPAGGVSWIAVRRRDLSADYADYADYSLLICEICEICG